MNKFFNTVTKKESKVFMATTTYISNAKLDGFAWVWNPRVKRYILTHNGELVRACKSLKEVYKEIAELRHVAKGNFCKFLRDRGYRKAWIWAGDTHKVLMVAQYGKYLGTYDTLEEAEAAAKEHERNRWN